MDIEKIVTTADRRKIKAEIAEWVREELTSQTRDMCETAAAKWMKDNKAEVEDMFGEAMSKNMPKLIKTFVDRAFYNIR